MVSAGVQDTLEALPVRADSLVLILIRTTRSVCEMVGRGGKTTCPILFTMSKYPVVTFIVLACNSFAACNSLLIKMVFSIY